MDEAPPNAVQVDYDGRPDGLTFVVGDRRVQLVHLHNGLARQSVMFKIQSTSSRKFRVRPGFGMISPRDSIAVQIQLSPQETEPSSCKFLVVVRRIDPQGVISGEAPFSRREASATVADRAQQQRDAEEKALWQRAEAQHQESLVLAETITATILPLDISESNESIQDPQAEAPHYQELISTHAAPTPKPTQSVEQLPLDSIEARAHVVVLMMKNQSKHPSNKLTVGELEALANLRQRNEDAWHTLVGYASRMRALARQYRRRQSRS